MKKGAALLLIAALGILAYSNTFHAPFQWDDKYTFLVENPIVKDLGYFVEPSSAEGLKLYEALKRRYVGYLSFALNYRFHGHDVAGYHAVNLVVHILNAFFVYLFVLLTFRTPFLEKSRLKDKSGYIALFTGLLFVSHPVQTEAVTYIFQRFESMMTMFFFISVVLYIIWRLYGMAERPSRYRLVAFYLLSLLSAVLAMKTKENAFILPFVISLYEFSFFKGKIRRRIIALVPFFIALLSIAHMFVGFFDMPVEGMLEEMEEGPAGYRGMSREDYVITQFRVVVTYIRLLFLPLNQNIDYDYPVFHSLSEPQVLLSFLFLISVFGFALSALIFSSPDRPDRRLIGVGVLWFFLALYVETGTVALPTIINEYRVYLPSSGAFFALTTGAFILLGKLKEGKPKKILAAAFIAVPIMLSIASFKRNTVWGSEVGLWEDAVRKSPGKARPHNNLGLALASAGRADEAVEHYHAALRINPYYYEAHNNLGSAYSMKGLGEEAMEHYEAASRIKPDSARLHFNLGNAHQKDGRFESAVFHYRLALSLEPGFSEAACNLGSIHASRGEPEKAKELYLAALSLDPENVTALNNLGLLYMTDGLFEKAVEQYLTAIKMRPEDEAAYFNLGSAYGSRGMDDKAIEHYEAAIRLNPDNPKTRNNIGLSLLYTGKTDKAIGHFLKAVSINPSYEKAHNNLGLAYEAEGRHGDAINHYTEAVRLRPDYADAHKNLGIAYSKIGNNEKAKEHFLKYKELKANGKD